MILFRNAFFETKKRYLIELGFYRFSEDPIKHHCEAKNHFLSHSKNSEVFASELLDSIVEMFFDNKT